MSARSLPFLDGGRWWLSSTLVHIALVGAAVAVLPHAGGLPQEFVAEVTQQQLAELKPKVEELASIHATLAGLAEGRKQAFRTFLADNAAQAPDQARSAMQRALERLASAQALLPAVESGLAALASDAMLGEEAWNAARGGVGRAIDAVGLANAETNQVVEQAGMAIGLAGASAAEAQRLHALAAAAQQAAVDAQAAAGSAINEARKAVDAWRKCVGQVDKLAAAAAKVAGDADKAVAELDKARTAAAAAATRLEQAKAAAPGDGDAKAKARRAAEQAKALKGAEEAVARSAAAVAKAEANLAKLQDGRTRAQEQVTANQAAVTAGQEARAVAVAKAATLVASIRTAVERCRQQQEAALAALPTGAAADIPDARLPAASALLRVPESLLSPAVLYQLAVAIEGRIVGDYRCIRAADLGMIRRIPYPQAEATTEVPQPQRPTFDPVLLEMRIGTSADGRDAREEVAKATAEVDNMLAQARRLLLELERQTAVTTLDAVKLAQERQELMDKMAAEDPGQRTKDLAELMAEATAARQLAEDPASVAEQAADEARQWAEAATQAAEDPQARAAAAAQDAAQSAAEAKADAAQAEQQAADAAKQSDAAQAEQERAEAVAARQAADEAASAADAAVTAAQQAAAGTGPEASTAADRAEAAATAAAAAAGKAAVAAGKPSSASTASAAASAGAAQAAAAQAAASAGTASAAQAAAGAAAAAGDEAAAGASRTAAMQAAQQAVAAAATARAAAAKTGASITTGAATAGPASAGGRAGLRTAAHRGEGRPADAPPPLKDMRAVPGRQIRSDGTQTGWMFVDSWYVVGPFANPARSNLNTKFPPESVIDLDGAYPAGDGTTVRWRFWQSAKVMAEPPGAKPYAIFYAYTEVYSDADRDLWIAVGSDDNSRLWINDFPVWLSGYQLKPWRLDEGWRKVSFRKGNNRILYRIENGWGGMAFSLLIATQPPVK